jgi:hypothetical protein
MCYKEELTVKIYATNTQNNILQASTFADNTGDYGTNGELYITNFHTLKTPMQYTVSINRETFEVGTLTFKTVK